MLRNERWVDRFSYFTTDSLFYEAVDEYYIPSASNYALLLSSALREKLIREGIWWVFKPGVQLPKQGWKIHISAHPKNAEQVLTTVAEYLFRKGIPFKFALDSNMLELLNSKAMPRGSSGKFITIYPVSLSQFLEAIDTLSACLEGEKGPYILSDMRYKNSKVMFFRYGAFVKKETVDIMGRRIPVVSTPKGELIPDRREAYFCPPEWATWPFDNWPVPADSEGEGLVLNDRYEVLEAISFSNSGGVYKAKDLRTGKKVVVKEARPYTNFNASGDYDAVNLLRKEWEILKILKGAGIAPKPIELFQEWEHLYLVEEFVGGIDIRQALFKKCHPLLKVRPTRQDSLHYLKSFFRLFRNFASSMQKAHEQGILLGDLSATNLLLKRNSYRVIFIDFEASVYLSKKEDAGITRHEEKPVRLYTPGFRRLERAFDNVYDPSDDLFGLASVMCYYIYPVNAYLALRGDLFNSVYPELFLDMGWPEELWVFIVSIVEGKVNLKEIIDFLKNREAALLRKVHTPSKKVRWSRATNSLVAKSRKQPTAEKVAVQQIPPWLCGYVDEITRFIEESADLSRGTLFPCDPFTSLSNPLSLGFGSGGVLYVLNKIGKPIPQEWRRWFLQKTRTVNPQYYPPGLLTGMAGLAWILLELGEKELGEQLLEEANRNPLLTSDYTLYYGMSGVGMANLKYYLATGDRRHLEAAIQVYQHLKTTARYEEGTCFWSNQFTGQTPLTGLGFGQAGVALFLLRLYQVTGDPESLHLGEATLHADLVKAVSIEPGVVSFRHEDTLEPYVEVGSAGIAKVLLRYGWNQEAQPVLNDLLRKYYVLPGYLFGASGVIDALFDAYLLTGNPDYLRKLQLPLEGLRTLHLFRPSEVTPLVPSTKIPAGLAVPGEGLLRVSCDFGTGVAGVLWVLHRLLQRNRDDFMLDEVSAYENTLAQAG